MLYCLYLVIIKYNGVICNMNNCIGFLFYLEKGCMVLDILFEFC